ncbi:AAA family ATPase [Ramlibacter alkalitolerans]|uniref:AAA family ATPase n=1 Tax=Ramlibacter alkalitolerans TaxID=2039631 RepID=A0ABS1JTY8_9BURK|nr:AAA family ATPase [Ramlibacter alkalitolerans]MBL0427719.1 AAA family ATPase [Ramlibacter alkalitolerans]
MPDFLKRFIANPFARYALLGVLLLVLSVQLVAVVQEVRGTPKKPTIEVVLTQDIGEVTALPAKKERLEYLLVAKPTAERPRYVYKLGGENKLHVVQVPSSSHYALEREVLLKNSVPYKIADKKFLAANPAVLEGGEGDSGAAGAVGDFVMRFLPTLFILAFAVYMMKAGMPGMASKANMLQPADLKGSMDDLIGMDDIKREVSHLVEMIRDREKYAAHGIDKPFNVMFTGPAGTGKTKLAGYLAKELGMPLITASGSGLESGFVGGGSRTLTKLYARACEMGNCVIFLDEAQSLFMPRGRGQRKYDDDTANMLLGLLDGVGVKDDGSRVIWVVASNFDDANSEMDEAMLRRFQVKINFRLPNRAEREALLKAFLAKRAPECVDWANTDLRQVAEITANLSPALLESTVDRASMIAIQEKAVINTELLFRAFERTAIGLTDRATTADKARERERIALHELGHFFMAVHPLLQQGKSLAEVKAQCRTLKISTEAVSKMGALGFVLSAGEDAKLNTRQELEQEVMQLYGGAAAEEMFYGESGVSTGSQTDIEKATRILQTVVARLSLYSRSKLDYSQLQAKGVDEKALAAIEAKSAELYEQTLTALRGYEQLMQVLKGVLLDRFVLSKDEVFDLMEGLAAAKCDAPASSTV